MIRHRYASAVATLAVLSLTCPAVSQAQLDFGVFVGQVNPTNSAAVAEDGSAVVQLRAFTVYGARLGWWFGPRLGVEAAAAYGRGDMDIIGGTLITLDTGMLQADVVGRYRLTGDETGGIHLKAGIGLNDLQNALVDASDQAGGTGGFSADMVIGGVLGIGGTLPVTDRLSLRFDFEDRIYSSEFEIDEAVGNPFDDARPQHDLMLSVGVVLPTR